MATPDPSSGNQPKIVQKLLVRTALFLALMAAVFGGLRWFQAQQGDFDKGGDSTGMVAAIQRRENGQEAVLIKPDGAIVGTKTWHDGVTDREPVWSPDGKFLFFASDRKDNTFHIFRWNPQSDDAQQRTEKGGSRSNPTFAPGDTEGKPLIVAGGMVRELDPATHKTPQILPPANAEIARSGSGDESGTEGSLSIYGGLGNSFRIARYLPGRQSIAAILRRDEGEVLILQNLTPVNEKVPRPIPIVAGDRIDFDLDPTNGQIVFVVQGFRWVDKESVPEQFHKGNRITTPFRNMMGFADPKTGQQTLMGATNTEATVFGAPHVSPDGTRVLTVGGKLVEGAIQPQALLIMPLRQAAVSQSSTLVQGEVYEPSWSADGSRIVFARRTNGKRDIISIKSDGTDEKNLTNGKGDFANPLFSPMTAKG